MSDSFAEEFEKWLENNPDARNADETDEEEVNYINDNDSEYTRTSVHNDECESDSEKWDKHLSDRHGELVSASLNDQAPILVDDDDDDSEELFPSTQQQYEEEPPVLEPVQLQLNNYNISSKRIPHQNPVTCIRSYSKSQQKYSKNFVTKEQRQGGKYANKNKVNHPPSHAADDSNHINELTSMDNKSDNIFDKFISQKYTFPPSLNNSSEVLQSCLESPGTMAKHPSHSPDFCAMEADSTSEINADKVGSVIQYRRLSKSSVHGDISVECDSTCMLAASPIVVSPASISNGETEEARDSNKDENKDSELESSDIQSKKCIDDGVTNCEEKSTDMHNADQDNCEAMKYTSETNGSDNDVELAAAEEITCPKDSDICDIGTFSDSGPKSSVTIKIYAPDCVSDCPGEPPVLSVVRSSTGLRYSLRGKRHTVDSLDNCSTAGKRAQLTVAQTDSECAMFKTVSPPTLIRASEAVITNNSADRRAKVMSQQHKHGCVSCHQHTTLNQGRRRRRNTVPSTNVAECYTRLSEDVQNFVVYASQLSCVQSHMHKLLSVLFPQLKTELGAMSPESLNFMSLLSNLVKLLEQPDDQDNSTPPRLILYRDVKPTSVHQHPYTSQLNHSSCGISDESSSSVLSGSCFQASSDTTDIKLDATFSEFSSPPVLSSIDDIYDCEPKQHTTTQQLTSEDSDKDLLAPLSLLTVSDMEEVLTPSQVLLCKEPKVVLEKFVRLSCQALQLLLPDLTISLYNELAKSPDDLVAFINNVIYTNSRRRSKH